jgi:hypothetical protein
MIVASQIELFDRCAAIVFAKLYESFPLRITIDYYDVPISLFEESDSSSLVAHKFEIYEATIRWLREAGFIWAGDVDRGKACDMVLSPKGLEVLKVPSSISKKPETLGQLLVEAVKNGAKDVAKNGVSAALTAGFKLLVAQAMPGAENGIQV